MFLPMELRDRLRDVSITDAQGRAIPLVRSERVIFRATREPLPEAPSPWIPRYLLAGLAVGAGLAAAGAWAARRRAGRYFLGAAACIVLLAVGVLGTVICGLWAFTDHAVTFRNENVLQANPLHLILAVLFPLALLRGRALPLALRLAAASAAVAVLGFALQVVPGLDQVNGEVIAFALPVHLGLAAALWLAHPRSRVPAA